MSGDRVISCNVPIYRKVPAPSARTVAFNNRTAADMYSRAEPPTKTPNGVIRAKHVKRINVCGRVKVLRVIVRANAKAAVLLCKITAMNIMAADIGSLIPNATPKKKEGVAIIAVRIIGMVAGIWTPCCMGSEFETRWPARCSIDKSRMNAAIAMTDATGKLISGKAWPNTLKDDGSNIINERARKTPDENASPLGNPSILCDCSDRDSGR